MATPPSPRRRKVRHVRSADTADDLVVVVRATPANRADAIDALVETASESAATYVVITATGDAELLFGVSVFALRPGLDSAEVLERFPYAPTFVSATVGALRAAGFAVLPTGMNPEHFDVQLLPGCSESPASAEADVTRCRRSPARCCGRLPAQSCLRWWDRGAV